ncbi:MAG: hypothetical protein CMM01_15620 [Rhodopirellula sp.]|nr:hypothetical protein [Rhodopirellula sp.]
MRVYFGQVLLLGLPISHQIEGKNSTTVDPTLTSARSAWYFIGLKCYRPHPSLPHLIVEIERVERSSPCPNPIHRLDKSWRSDTYCDWMQKSRAAGSLSAKNDS